MTRTCKFCEFLRGNAMRHEKGYPFIILHETKKSVSFLSEDIPENKDAHILVIPKKHYQDMIKIPPDVLDDLIEHVALACSVIEKRHGGYNILLNNGRSANQIIPHTHFHIIPRDKHDHIRVEVWKRARIPLAQFINLHKSLQKEFSTLTKKR